MAPSFQAPVAGDRQTDRRNKNVSCSTKQTVIRTRITSDDHSTDLLVHAYAEYRL